MAKQSEDRYRSDGTKGVFSMRLDDDQIAHIRRIAQRQGVSVSALLRGKVDQLINESGAESIGEPGAALG